MSGFQRIMVALSDLDCKLFLIASALTIAATCYIDNADYKHCITVVILLLPAHFIAVAINYRKH